MLEELKTIMKILEGDDFKKVNDEQVKKIKSRFNTYIDFEYQEDGGYWFRMSSDTFKTFEYYLGMEYEQEYIENKIEISDEVLVCYSYDCERAEDLFEMLEESEEK